VRLVYGCVAWFLWMVFLGKALSVGGGELTYNQIFFSTAIVVGAAMIGRD